MLEVPKWLIIFVKDMVLFVKLDEVLFDEDVVDDSWFHCFSLFLSLGFALESLANFLVHIQIKD